MARKEEKTAAMFRKGEKVTFWGRSYRIGRIVLKLDNVAVVKHEKSIWHVPYTCLKKI